MLICAGLGGIRTAQPWLVYVFLDGPSIDLRSVAWTVYIPAGMGLEAIHEAERWLVYLLV